VHDDIWLVSFIDYDLGYFDLETRVLEPLENPSAQSCYLCSRYVLLPICPGWTYRRCFWGEQTAQTCAMACLRQQSLCCRGSCPEHAKKLWKNVANLKPNMGRCSMRSRRFSFDTTRLEFAFDKTQDCDAVFFMSGH
jgi:hypothetical protein